MIKLIISLLSIVLLTSIAHANEPSDWYRSAIKVKDPNQLAYFVTVTGSCPISLEETQKITEGVFIRSRIKPLKNDIFVNGRIYFSLSLNCVELENDHPVFVIRSEFGRYRPHPAVLFDRNFGFNGIGSKDYIEQQIKSSTERAITSFIKSNFDL